MTKSLNRSAAKMKWKAIMTSSGKGSVECLRFGICMFAPPPDQINRKWAGDM